MRAGLCFGRAQDRPKQVQSWAWKRTDDLAVDLRETEAIPVQPDQEVARTAQVALDAARRDRLMGEKVPVLIDDRPERLVFWWPACWGCEWASVGSPFRTVEHRQSLKINAKRNYETPQLISQLQNPLDITECSTLNDYSVPVAYGYRQVWVRGYVDRVVIGCAAEVIARHPRSYEGEDMVFDPPPLSAPH